ncbi:unnamed protein product, partial [Polarella glacialis]
GSDSRPPPYDLKRSSAPSTGSPSEDGDAMSSVSAGQSQHDTRRPSVLLDGGSVIGLRDNLLQAARKERQICLDREEKRRSVELRASRDASTQTDPVSLASERRPSALLSTGMLDMTVSTGSSQLGWSRADEEAQSEAVRTIQLLAQRGSSSRGTEGRVAELEAQLQAERSARQERETQQAHERSRKEAAQQQVLCLEYELDGKEAALQVAERTLERRDADLQQAQLQLRVMEGGLNTVASVAATSEDPRLKMLRSQLGERERQLELKDQHIERLLNVLKQHRTTFESDSMLGLSSTTFPRVTDF